MCSTLVDSMPKRVKMLMKAKGGPYFVSKYRLSSNSCGLFKLNLTLTNICLISPQSELICTALYQHHKSRSFRVRRDVSQASVLGPVLFSYFINDLPASLPSSVSCPLYADMWPLGPAFPRYLLRWRPHIEFCFNWSAGLSTGVFLSIRTNVRPPSFQ